MSILDSIRRRHAEEQTTRRTTAIGADLIPRAPVDDPRYAGVDLAARGHDRNALRVGVNRLTISPADLSNEYRKIAERIATELQDAGSEEIGRYATDVLYAYSDVPCLSAMVESAMFHAWALCVERKDSLRPREKREIRD